MITCYMTDINGTLVTVDTPEAGAWINVVSPTPEESAWLEREIGVLPEFVRSALDEEETSHIDYDDDVNQALIIVDYPCAEDAEDMQDPAMLQYTTMPISFFSLPAKNLVVTLSLQDNPIVTDMAAGRVRGLNTRLRTRFLLQMLLRVSQSYLIALRRIDALSTKTEQRLYGSMRNEELLQMLSLEKSLVYFSTSLKSAEVTLNKIMHGHLITLYEDDQDLMDDVMIEVHQAQEMCNIYSNILSGTMDAYASVISNNLNIVMKVLTVLTIVMAIPNMIFGFWGMNVDLPFAASPLFNTWVFPLVLAVVLCLVCAYIFKRKGLWH
ncbi:magnesium transporter CorA family protein [Collinsella intestinalis]|uniref:magnesium transporter CorA family protein n=1 Tax=Collinsella intestinalis TaxID=147207 RepID=UPI0025A38DD3|nr:magnesium transporter CorA family protein [Collinsella intestinalis]MDM8162902.1 magnesium transporter CorA family protein [Collinsella intestinalis]